MYIKSVDFMNWRGFGSEGLSFSQPFAGKHVCQVHGENGSGKTAILEGILACLFGALLINGDVEFLGRKRPKNHRGVVLKESYGAYIAKCRGLGNRVSSDNSTSVSVTLGLANGEADVAVRRQWFIDSDDVLVDVEAEIQSGSFNIKGRGVRSEQIHQIDNIIRERIFPPAIASILFGDDCWELSSDDGRRQLVERVDRSISEIVRFQSSQLLSRRKMQGGSAPADENAESDNLQVANLKRRLIQTWRNSFCSIMKNSRKNYFYDIYIDESFNVTAENGQSINGLLASGEWYILEVTLRTTIAREVRGLFPIAFEDPFGLLDQFNRDLLIRHFCVAESQLMLLFNEAQLSERERHLLNACSAAISGLKYCDGGSRIVNEL